MPDGSHARAEADNKLPANWKAVLRVQLRNLVKSGKLVKPPGKNAYKLGESLKKAPKKKAVSNPATCTAFRRSSSDPTLGFRVACAFASFLVWLLHLNFAHCLQAPKKATATKAKPAAKKTTATKKKAAAKPKAASTAAPSADGDAAAPAAAKKAAPKKKAAAKPKGVAVKSKAKKATPAKKVNLATQHAYQHDCKEHLLLAMLVLMKLPCSSTACLSKSCF